MGKRRKLFSLSKGTNKALLSTTAYCFLQAIVMRLTNVLERVIRMVRDTNQTSTQTSTGRGQEQRRDESSMADFVRILQDHDRRSS